MTVEKPWIELYSDTKTKPTDGMRLAMYNAVVGDEQHYEDPTVTELCRRVAELLGKEDAVYLPSGTMANEIALQVHCRPGDEVVADQTAHLNNSEGGGPSANAGVTVNKLDGPEGIYTAQQLSAAINRPPSRYSTRPRLVWVEQTSNFGGGTIWPLERIQEVCSLARKANLKLHMDGARLMNAVVGSGVSAKDYADSFDSVWIDFSKGLGAPVGAVLAGSKAFIQEAWRVKQRLGGSMRQAGIIAAGALYSLDHHVDRLKDDHTNAQVLAEGLSKIPGISVRRTQTMTNIVWFDVSDTGLSAAEVVHMAQRAGIGLGTFGPTLLRAVTHLSVSRSEIDQALSRIQTIVEQNAKPQGAQGNRSQHSTSFVMY